MGQNASIGPFVTVAVDIIAERSAVEIWEIRRYR